VVILSLCNFIQGFKQFLDLSLLSLYKNTLDLEPEEVQAFMGIICLPMSFRIIYGFMSDNVQVLGSRRKGHIIMNCICCITSMTALITMGTYFGKYFVTACVMISMMNIAYCDTVTDALTV
jgi:hypothetical protein